MEAIRRAVAARAKITNIYVRIAMAEFVGTSVAVIIGDGSLAQQVLSRETSGDFLSVNLAWCLGITMGAYISGGVSGAHLNPAVSFTMSILGRIPWKLTPIYMLAQYVGAFFGAFIVYATYFEALTRFDGGQRYVSGTNGTAAIFATYPAEHVGMAQGLFDQVVGTSLLMLCIMAATDGRNLALPRHVAPLAVGLMVLAIGTSLGYNCGYAINPARDLGPRLFTAAAGWGMAVFSYDDYQWFWIPVIGPHLGALAGALLYNMAIGCHWPEAEASMRDAEPPHSQSPTATARSEAIPTLDPAAAPAACAAAKLAATLAAAKSPANAAASRSPAASAPPATTLSAGVALSAAFALKKSRAASSAVAVGGSAPAAATTTTASVLQEDSPAAASAGGKNGRTKKTRPRAQASSPGAAGCGVGNTL